MSAGSSPAPAIGRPATAALVLAWIVVIPLLGIGALFTAPIVGSSILSGDLWPEILLGVVYASTALGIAGLIRSRAHGRWTAPAGIERTQYLLVIGIVTALCVIVPFVFDAIRQLYSGRMAYPWAIIALPLGIIVADGAARLRHLDRLLAADHGRPPNTLPLTMLGGSLGLAASVLLWYGG